MKNIFRNFLYLMLLAVVIISFVGCDNGSSSSNDKSIVKDSKTTFVNISPSQAKLRLDREKGIIILDVRSIDEYAEGHIKGALVIPVDELEKEARNKLPNKNTVIFVYCRSGNRSVTASNVLINQGYKKVYNLGGIIDWPYDIVSDK